MQGTKSIDLPIIGTRKKPKKLIFLDVGIVNHQMDMQDSYLKIKNLNDYWNCDT